MLVNVPARRNRKIKVPVPQVSSVQEQSSQQPLRPLRQPCLFNFWQREDLVNVRVRYQQRFVASLHNHRAARFRMSLLQCAKQRRGHYHIAQRVQAKDNERERLLLLHRILAAPMKVGAPEDRQQRRNSDRKEQRSKHKFFQAEKILLVVGGGAAAEAIRRVLLMPSTRGISSRRPPQARTSRAPTTSSSV